MPPSPPGAVRGVGGISQPRGAAALFLALFLALTLVVAPVIPATPAAADSIRDKQWQLGFLRAREAWRYSTGAGVKVAVIDSGVDATHPDLRGQVLPGIDFVDRSTDGRKDLVGHGTTVAALIAGKGDRSGVIGLAYQARILPVRVLDPQNKYDSADVVARAIKWAVDNGAKVINLSLGSADTAPVLTDAIRYAFDRNVVVVACDGNVSNNRGSVVWHPAREPGVLAVSGVGRSGRFWTGSLQGPATVLAAPAADLTGPRPGGGYWTVQGTSFAAPLVSAAAALLLARYPGISAADVVNRLVRTSWDFGPKGRDPQFGFGIVNPTRALTAPIASVRANPLLPSEPSPSSGGPAQRADPASPGDPNGAGKPEAAPRKPEPRWPAPALVFLVLSLFGAILAAGGAAVIIVLLSLRRPRRAVIPGPPSDPPRLPPPHSPPPPEDPRSFL